MNNDFDKIMNRSSNFIRWGMAIWVFCFVIGLGGLAALVYVAVHFLAKVW